MNELLDEELSESSASDTESQDEGPGRDRAANLANITGEDSDFTWSTDHVLLCALISFYGKCSLHPAEPESWIRSTPLQVLIFECISSGVLDFDYSPVLTHVSHKGTSKRIWLNLSQEAQSALDDLQENDVIRVLKMYTEDHKPSSCFQVSPVGLRMLKKVPSSLFDELKHIVYVPDKQNSYKDKLQIEWRAEVGKFALHSLKTGFFRYSAITDIEDVSYVSSPFIPNFLRRSKTPLTSNLNRAVEAFKGKTNIMDADLMEAISLGNVRITLQEWIPFGENSLTYISTNIGVKDRCQFARFSSLKLADFTGNNLATETGLTDVKILDYSEQKFLNVEAEIKYPEEEGIVQVEFFGIHVSARGHILFGLEIESIMTRMKDDISIDLLSRTIVDILQDSSTIIESILTENQKDMLVSLFQQSLHLRPKYNCFLAQKVEPLFLSCSQYLDGGDHENEIAQLIGSVRAGHDLAKQHFLFIGSTGVLLVGEEAHEYDSFLVPFCSLQSLQLITGVLFECFNHLNSLIDEGLRLLQEIESSPYNVARIQYVMTHSFKELHKLDFVLKHISDSIRDAAMPPEPRNDVGYKLLAVLKCRKTQRILIARLTALRNSFEEAIKKIRFVERRITSVNRNRLVKHVTSSSSNFERIIVNSVTYFHNANGMWAVKLLLIATFFSKLASKFRIGSSFCKVVPMVKNFTNLVAGSVQYTFIDPPNQIYSADCPWINPVQLKLNAYPFGFGAAFVVAALLLAYLANLLSFYYFKFFKGKFANGLRGWRVGFPDVKASRTAYRIDVNVPIREDALLQYLKGKVMVKSSLRQVDPRVEDKSSIKVYEWQERRWWIFQQQSIDVLFRLDSSLSKLMTVMLTCDRRVGYGYVEKKWNLLRKTMIERGVLLDSEGIPSAHVLGKMKARTLRRRKSLKGREEAATWKKQKAERDANRKSHRLSKADARAIRDRVVKKLHARDNASSNKTQELAPEEIIVEPKEVNIEEMKLKNVKFDFIDDQSHSYALDEAIEIESEEESEDDKR